MAKFKQIGYEDYTPCPCGAYRTLYGRCDGGEGCHFPSDDWTYWAEWLNMAHGVDTRYWTEDRR